MGSAVELAGMGRERGRCLREQNGTGKRHGNRMGPEEHSHAKLYFVLIIPPHRNGNQLSNVNTEIDHLLGVCGCFYLLNLCDL